MSDMSDRIVYFNGQILPAEDACLSVFDTGFLHGASVFTTLLVHNGRAFRLPRHLGRLLGNARRIGLVHPATPESLSAGLGELVAAAGLPEARVRITLSPGPVGEQPAPTTLITADPFRNDPRWYAEGLDVIINRVLTYRGDLIAGIKTGCYLTRVLARQAAASVGADEALWFNTDGQLAEACFCNVFLVRGGALATPPLDTPVLPGVVREAVIELCGQIGIACADDKPLTGADLVAAEEVFLTSSVAGIRPVVRIDRRPVGDEKPGPVARKIMAAYAALLDKECPPA